MAFGGGGCLSSRRSFQNQPRRRAARRFWAEQDRQASGEQASLDRRPRYMATCEGSHRPPRPPVLRGPSQLLAHPSLPSFRLGGQNVLASESFFPNVAGWNPMRLDGKLERGRTSPPFLLLRQEAWAPRPLRALARSPGHLLLLAQPAPLLLSPTRARRQPGATAVRRGSGGMGLEAGVRRDADRVLSWQPVPRGKQNLGRTGPTHAASEGPPEHLWGGGAPGASCGGLSWRGSMRTVRSQA